MQKSLITIIFVMAFVCGGVLVVSAKNSSPSNNSASVAKKAKAIANKIKAIKARCTTDCVELLETLLSVNEDYEAACAPVYFWLCQRDLADLLVDIGNEYNDNCANYLPIIAKNTDRSINRNKLAIDRNKLVKESRSKFKV